LHQLILIAKKHTHRVLPPGLLAIADEHQKMKATSEASGNEQLMAPHVEVPVEFKKAGKQYRRTSKPASKVCICALLHSSLALRPRNIQASEVELYISSELNLYYS
jgi:hypothetical protein